LIATAYWEGYNVVKNNYIPDPGKEFVLLPKNFNKGNFK
tara:strand:- start:54 stop:170 length:117 start_codon:yes stop_codon:yes gene_type:complete